MVEECRRCNSYNLKELVKEVQEIDGEEYIKVIGDLCDDCECFHYELDGFIITEYYPEVKATSNAVAGYTTDYQRKLMMKQNEFIQSEF